VSYPHINHVRDNSKTGGAPRLVLMTIASMTNKEGIAWPNLETLARYTRMSKRNVIRALKRIPADELEIITKGGSPKGGKRETSVYRIPVKTGDNTTPVSSSSRSVTSDTMTPVEDSYRCPTVTRTGDNFDTTGDKNGKRPVSYGHPNSHRTDNRTDNEQSGSADALNAPNNADSLFADSAEKKPSPRHANGFRMPDNLRTPEFCSFWEKWKRHRQEIRKPLRPTQEREQLSKFSEWGPERSVAAIRYTITMGWQGIREPEESKPQFRKANADYRRAIRNETRAV
jgi:hypothetical protein